ncbi:MAG: VOC family protein [Pseudonocardiaceae bacterium]
MKGSPVGRRTDPKLIAAGAPGERVHAQRRGIRAAGAEVLQEPIDQPYGVRDCAFRDPSGNMVRFSGRLKG